MPFRRAPNCATGPFATAVWSSNGNTPAGSAEVQLGRNAVGAGIIFASRHFDVVSVSVASAVLVVVFAGALLPAASRAARTIR
jgi:hypothetical protein